MTSGCGCGRCLSDGAGGVWRPRRAVMLKVGDVTPAGPVLELEHYGDLRRMDLRIGGQRFGRGFDDLVDVLEPATIGV